MGYTIRTITNSFFQNRPIEKAEKRQVRKYMNGVGKNQNYSKILKNQNF